MQIPPTSSGPLSPESPQPVDLPKLKRELKTNIDKVRHLLEEAVNQPGHIQHGLCQELSQSLLELDQLSSSSSRLNLDSSPLAASIKNATSTLNLLLQAPLHV